jgi:hypothetical protein
MRVAASGSANSTPKVKDPINARHAAAARRAVLITTSEITRTIVA